MTRIRLVGEDALCCALGVRLVAEALPGWSLAGDPINALGITKLVPNLHRYRQQAQHVQPVLCIADTDHRCPVELLREWSLSTVPESFVFRLAVSEAESWVLADRHATAEFFGVALKHVPEAPERVPDAKRIVLRLASLSRNRSIRQEMVSPTDLHKPGSGYNLHLCRLVAGPWQAARAAANSESLGRALRRLQALRTVGAIGR